MKTKRKQCRQRNNKSAEQNAADFIIAARKAKSVDELAKILKMPLLYVRGRLSYYRSSELADLIPKYKRGAKALDVGLVRSLIK